MLNVAYRDFRKRRWRGEFPRRSRSDRAKSAQALFRGHRDQPDGGAAAGKAVSRRVVRLRRAGGDRAPEWWRSPEVMAPQGPGDLARAPQQRDDRGRAVARARLAAQARLHLGGTTPS